MRILICGGGVIGASIAYFLSRRNIDVTVIEQTAVACAASGKSGGFLALDWCAGGPLDPLARRSFALHAELAETIEADYGYRRMTTYAGVAGRGFQDGGNAFDVEWLSPAVALNQRLGTIETTAQVQPGAFTKALMAEAERNGATLRHATVTGIARAERDGAIGGVIVDDQEIIEGDAVVIAMGPWSILASAWLPLPGVYGMKGHSLVFDTPEGLPADALFIEYHEASGDSASPEVFPRPDGTTYVCGVSAHDSPLPVDPAAVSPDPGAIERLEAMCAAMSPTLAGATIVARQSCFRPVTQDGLPLIGAIPGIAGAYVATGHSVWGILNAPATGEAMAELIVDGATTIDLGPFDPQRLPAFAFPAETS